jgi:hypothetical protein
MGDTQWMAALHDQKNAKARGGQGATKIFFESDVNLADDH